MIKTLDGEQLNNTRKVEESLKFLMKIKCEVKNLFKCPADKASRHGVLRHISQVKTFSVNDSCSKVL